MLTYIDKGLGASILKAGLRLWDAGDLSPVAAIKITRHNLLRPTALIHEAGHQVAHIAGWNQELAAALSQGLAATSSELAGVWAGWASEIAADAVAFVHTGFASVAALHDVLAGETSTVFRHTPGDPHPICYLRVLLGVEMCRHFYGSGPVGRPRPRVDGRCTRRDRRRARLRRLLDESMPVLKTVVQDDARHADAGVPRRAAARDRPARSGSARRRSTRWPIASARRSSRRRTGSGPNRCASSR